MKIDAAVAASPVSARRRLEVGPLLAVTDEQQPDPMPAATKECDRLDEVGDALVGGEARDVADDRLAVRDAELRGQCVISRTGR